MQIPTAPSTNRSTTRPDGAPGRRKGLRLTTASHDEFVSSLLDQFDTTLQTGDSRDVGRLVNVLEAMDGPAARRRVVALSLSRLVLGVIEDLDLPIAVSGRVSEECVVADARRVRTGVELSLLALAGKDEPAQLEIRSDRLIVVEGGLDPGDDVSAWRIRYGRLVLEGEGCRSLLYGAGGRYTLQIRAGR